MQLMADDDNVDDIYDGYANDDDDDCNENTGDKIHNGSMSNLNNVT